MRVEEAGSSLNHADSLIISLNLVHVTCLARDNGNQVQTEILWVEIGGESVRKSLLLASRDLNIVTSSGDIADNGSTGMCARCQWLQSGQRAANESYLDRFRLIVREIQDSLCGMPIDELDAEDLSIGERCGDRDGKVG